MNRLLIAPLLALLALLSACERAEAPAPPHAATSASPSAAGDALAGGMRECVDGEQGFSVAYPASWHPDRDEVVGPCALFHPDPFEVPRDSEVPIEIAVMIGIQPVAYREISGETMGRRVISRESTTVDGREAVRILGETTGEGLHDAGIRMYEYLVDLGEETLIAVTYDAGTPPFQEGRRVLDAMMASFDFRQPG